jgi:hypothetical protein
MEAAVVACEAGLTSRPYWRGKDCSRGRDFGGQLPLLLVVNISLYFYPAMVRFCPPNLAVRAEASAKRGLSQ